MPKNGLRYGKAMQWLLIFVRMSVCTCKLGAFVLLCTSESQHSTRVISNYFVLQSRQDCLHIFVDSCLDVGTQ